MTTVAEQSIKPPITAADVQYSEYLIESGSPYDYIRKSQQSGLSDVELTSSGGTNVDFLIDSGGFYNLGKSFFTGYYSLASAADLHPFLHANPANFISSITVTGTSSGSQLMNITNFNRAQEYLSRRDTAYDDVASRDMPGPVAAAQQLTLGDNFEGLALNTRFNHRPTWDIKNSQSISGTVQTDGGGSIEPGYFIVQQTISGNLAQNFRLKFSDVFKHTFLGLDKVVYFPEQLRITITLAPLIHVCFTSLNLTMSGTTIAAPTTSAYLKNFTLNLAQCQNPMTKQKILSEVQNGGIKLLTENLHTTLQNLNGSQQTVQLRLQPGLGSAVSSIHMVPYNNSSTTGNLVYDHSNLKVNPSNLSGIGVAGGAGLSGVGAKITGYYTQINNVKVNRSDYDCTKLQDWYEVREKLRGSCISNAVQFNAQFGNDIYFNGPDNSLQKSTNISVDNQAQGMVLNEEKLIEMVATTGVSGNTINHLSVAILKRHISITPQGFFSTV